jgi:hypothetical protein
MSYDIAIGKCVSLDAETAQVAIDTSVLLKLAPRAPFPIPPKAFLRIPVVVCSSKREPKRGQELFVDFDKIKDGCDAMLDVRGDGDFRPTDMRKLLVDLNPADRPTPAAKSRGFYS